MASQVFVSRSALVALTFSFLTPLFLFACAGAENIPPPPPQDTIAEGPGLFSGEEGGFTVSRNIGKDAEAEEQQDAPPSVSQGAAQDNQIIERQSRMLDRQSQMLDRQGRELERLENEVEQLRQELETLRSKGR